MLGSCGEERATRLLYKHPRGVSAYCGHAEPWVGICCHSLPCRLCLSSSGISCNCESVPSGVEPLPQHIECLVQPRPCPYQRGVV